MIDIAGDQILSIVERVERLEAEIKELNADKSEVYAEAKANGYDVKVLKAVVARRRKDAAEIEEHDAILELYLDALSRAGARMREGRPS